MNATDIRRRTFLAAAPVLMSLAGCSLLPTPNEAQIYRLLPEVEDPPAHPVPHSALTIELPFAPGSLNTNRIALTQGRTRFDYYADSVWTDRLPVLLQTLLVEAFEADASIAEVGRDGDGIPDGYQLRTEIRQFEAQYAAAGTEPAMIAIVLKFQLSTKPEGRLIGSKLVSARTQASRNELNGIVTAFDAATGEALAQGIGWTVQAISGDRAHGVRPQSD